MIQVSISNSNQVVRLKTTPYKTNKKNIMPNSNNPNIERYNKKNQLTKR
jgi:hypothetical protein